MEIYEITGSHTATSKAGVNFLQPSDSYSEIVNGFIYRQVVQSRRGISLFAPRLANNTRVTGIFTIFKPDGSTILLASDLNYLYKYNTTTKVFVQILPAGSMVGYAGFAIGSNLGYISGTAYPTKTNGFRFVFTGSEIASNGNSSVFFYNGTDIRDYALVGDNPDYVNPSEGQLRRALHVVYFNERLNFINPTIDATTYSQGFLFSGIRNSAGNGDKYNVAGSGLGQLDTTDTISGASIFGQYLALNLSNSNWLLERTTDAFNPYFPKKLPSVIGTDAPFSDTQWNSHINSMGRDGILGMDFRESLRIDNKIPNFTRDEIDNSNFNLTYGGFDRDNAQFLWSYVKSGPVTASPTQNSVLVYNYEENSWSTFDLRLTVFETHDGDETLVWSKIDGTIDPSWARWDTTEKIWNKIGLGTNYKATLAGDNDGFIYKLNQDFDDYFTNITAITKATQAVLTIEASAFKAGDQVVVQNVSGMTEINNYDPVTDTYVKQIYTVVFATATSITLNIDSTAFTTYTSGGTLSKPIFFEATTNPINPYRANGLGCFMESIEFLLNTDGGYLYVDIFLNEETTPFKENILVKPDNTTQKLRQWIAVSVDQEADFFTIRIRQDSPAVGVQLTSMRLHMEPGGFTSG